MVIPTDPRAISLFLLLASCARAQPTPVKDTESVPEYPGVIRVGPPASTVGPYGIVADPERLRLFISNLHTPFITIVDSRDGSWLDAIDMREVGIDAPGFPRLFKVDDTLLITQANSEQVLRYDLSNLEPLASILLPAYPRDAFSEGSRVCFTLANRKIQCFEGTKAISSINVKENPMALAVEGDKTAFTDTVSGLIALHENARRMWEITVKERTLEDVLIINGRVFVSDRASGKVMSFEDGVMLDSLVTGSDTFSLTRIEDDLLVMNRQGASFPESGSYEGAPSLVSRLDRDLNVLWTLELEKTAHYLTFDGLRWWTVNEDSLDLSSFSTDGVPDSRAVPIGLTLDGLSEHQGSFYMASHLSDEIWRVDPMSGASESLETCGWPFEVVMIDERAWAPCQEDGSVISFDPLTLKELERRQVADSFFELCEDGLCTGHARLIAADQQDNRLVWSDPHLPGLRWLDGQTLEIPFFSESDHVQHQDLAVLPNDPSLFYFESGQQRLYRVLDGSLMGSVDIEGETAAFALVPDQERIWAGHQAYDANLSIVGAVRADDVIVAAAQGWLIAERAWELVVIDRETLTEIASLPMERLRSAPLVKPESLPSPLRYGFDQDVLWVVNTFRGTLEPRSLPELEPLGSDDIVASGPWAHLPGLR